jgi:hypothetical protein
MFNHTISPKQIDFITELSESLCGKYKNVLFFFVQTLHTNTLKWKEGRRRDAELEVSWTKGEEVGEFRMGSTIVLIFEAPPNFRLSAGPGHRTRVGCPLTATH